MSINPKLLIYPSFNFCFGNQSILKEISPGCSLEGLMLKLKLQYFGHLMWRVREGNGTPLQYSCLENPMDRGAWKAAVHGVAEGRTRLSDFTFTFDFHALEKEMATHSSVLAWRIPGMGEPGGLPSMGSHRVGHDWSDLAVAACEGLTHWKRPWCWEGLGAGGGGDDRGWDGWMASPTRWTWVWVNSGSWWWTGRPGVLWFMG